MSSNTENSKPRQFTGWHFLMFIVGFFAVIISVNLTMAYFAVDTFSGLETEDAYRKGRDYNQTLEAAKRQASLGWQEEVTLSLAGLGANAAHHIVVTLKGAEAEEGMKARLLLKRPATNVDDQLVVLVETTPATFEGVVERLEPGRWKISLIVERSEGVVFRKNSEIMVSGP